MISNQQHTNHPAIHVSDAQSAKNRICGGVLGELEITHVKSLQGGTSGALQQEISELEHVQCTSFKPRQHGARMEAKQ